MPLARFAVGDRAEYWSETYRQWMPGTIQRVRDDGAAYDLDVKKGAQASKLRLAQSSVQDRTSLFSIVDRNHDGIISRAEFQGALDNHTIESGYAAGCSMALSSRTPTEPIAQQLSNTYGGSLRAPPTPGSPPPRPSARTPSAPLSARRRGFGETLVQTQDFPPEREAPGSEPRHRSSAREADAMASQIKRRAESHGALARHMHDLPGRSTALQARQLQSELAQVTRTIRQQQQPRQWAEVVGQDMVSRAGVVTVRKMVETTKNLLQSLEGALILRAGFIAGCFHMWRCETTLSRTSRIWHEEVERNHDQWSACLDHHKQGFETELTNMASKATALREKTRMQNALLIDKWAHGDTQGLMRESLRAWCHYLRRQREMKNTAARIHVAVGCWAEGREQGWVRSCLRAWHHDSIAEGGWRRKDAHLESERQAYEARSEEERSYYEQRLQERLEEIEAKDRKGKRAVEMVLAKAARGLRKGSLNVIVRAWHKHCQQEAEKSRRHVAMDMQLRCWCEGMNRGGLHSCFIQWRNHSVQAAVESRHAQQLVEEAERLQRMITDVKKAHEDRLQEQLSETEKRKQRGHRAVEAAMAKWEQGDRKGRLRCVVQAWSSFAEEVKRHGRSRQAVHDAMLRFVEGEQQAAVHMTFMNWAADMRASVQARQAEECEAQESQRWQTYLQEAAQTHAAELDLARDSAAVLRAHAKGATEAMLRRWVGGDEKGLQVSVFVEWTSLMQRLKKTARNKNAVRDSVLRFVEGETRGTAVSALISWKNYVKQEAALSAVHREKDERIARLEQDVQKFLSHKEKRLVKYGEMLASKNGTTLCGLVWAAWKEESLDAKSKLEAQRLEEVQLEELERLHKLAETLHKEDKFRVLEAMGVKDGRVFMGEVFLAWSHYTQLRTAHWAHELNHNEAMEKYSLFLIGQKLKRDDISLVTACFSEWHRDAKAESHHRLNERAAHTAEKDRSYIARLEREKIELTEQLAVYYEQIDLITNTLQKELKTKEELATELRMAYSKMRRVQMTPTTAASERDRHPAEFHGMSRTSSNQTLDQDHLLTPDAGRAGASRRQPFVRTVNVGGANSIGVPELPPSPNVTLAGHGAGYGGGPRGVALCNDGYEEEVATAQCDWEQAVVRMDEEGLVRMDDHRSQQR